MTLSFGHQSQNDKICLEDLLRRLAALAPEPQSALIKSDRDLNPDLTLPTLLKPAAVLVPLVKRDFGFSVLLTLRQSHLSDHAGQVSFPGGRIDPHDSHAEEAALREAEEEVGIPPACVRPLGWLDPYVTVTGYHIAPLVGLIEEPPQWQPSAFEVAEVFEVPLTFLLDSESLKTHSFITPKGKTHHTYVYNYQQYHVWGATAAMLHNLIRVLQDAEG